MAIEKRLIDANAFTEDIKTEIVNLRMDGLKGTPRPCGELYDIIDRIGEQPTVDAVEVVRCKECKQWSRNIGIADSPNGHCFCHDIETNGHDFCSYGERREGE